MILAGVQVELDMGRVHECSTPESIPAVAGLRGLRGRVQRLYSAEGWDMAAVDFGDAGTWNGPLFMLRVVLADA